MTIHYLQKTRTRVVRNRIVMPHEHTHASRVILNLLLNYMYYTHTHAYIYAHTRPNMQYRRHWFNVYVYNHNRNVFPIACALCEIGPPYSHRKRTLDLATRGAISVGRIFHTSRGRRIRYVFVRRSNSSNFACSFQVFRRRCCIRTRFAYI